MNHGYSISYDEKERGFILLDLCMAIGIVVIVLALTIPYRAFDRENFL